MLFQLWVPSGFNRKEEIVNYLKKYLSSFLCCCLLLPLPRAVAWQEDEDETVAPAPVQSAQLTPEQAQQLVAPIALYPDSLVAQILAASTYPEQIVEADRWMQQQPGFTGEDLAQQVDQQLWDPSVKALTQFPSVLANMDKNLSWTSSLGDAYVNHQQEVMDAIQVMRQKAEEAGNLRTTPEQTVTTNEKTIVIEPADPDIVYVPQYDPWLAYGSPIVAWPGWYGYPGLYMAGPGIGFGLGLGIGFLGGFGWGWHSWGFDWGHRALLFNHRNYIAHGGAFFDRNGFDHGRATFGGHDFGGHDFGARGGFRGGAFNGFNGGGVTRGYSMRGFHSFGGFHGGGFHGGGFGGGFHGGGGGHR
ncbi:MAG TPA: DUF3300 domain-containing protein [Bryobacteraceae bacterium]|nr:DUF3300 domain-containing protein [Bryobacteraceae bacterium]